jgi:two-component system CheB/CheR fusion protein
VRLHQLLVEEEDKLAHDLELLANVEQPIKNFRALTETQRMFVAILESNGNDGGAVTARALLNGLEQSQALHTEHRQRILASFHRTEEILTRILAHLRVRTGHDFSRYKRSTVLRRLARRMQVARTNQLRDYYDFMRDNTEEAQALLSDLLISVTTFFRDRDAFDAVAKLLPGLFAAKGLKDPIRVWSAGCATGEEAFSLGILMLEEAARHDVRPPIQIFGSDLDVRGLAAAREARFPAAIEADVSEERLRRFFTRDGDQYRVRQELRDIVLFAIHDLLKDPPFLHMDLICCRNVMIYLDRDLQEQVCSTFHYALSPGGYLFLGAAETADNPPGLFHSIDRSARIYQSTAVPAKPPRLSPRLLGPVRIPEYASGPVQSLSPTAAVHEAEIKKGGSKWNFTTVPTLHVGRRLTF